jgi:phosphoribosyl 1,2-cyclic phosphate phosphodiesterase
VLFTHGHADHILGLDEVRRFNAIQGGAIPCYANAETWVTLRRTFSYIFDGMPRLGGGIPQLEVHEIGGPFTVHGVRVVPVPLWHGRRPVLGLRFPLWELRVLDRLQSPGRRGMGARSRY